MPCPWSQPPGASQHIFLGGNIYKIIILKFGYPKTLANSFTLSLRNYRNLIILPMLKNNQFHYKASVIWNDLIKPLKIPSFHEININRLASL